MKMQPHKKVNSLEYMRGDKTIKDITKKRKLKIGEAFLIREEEE